ncbi:DNA primase large subunit [Microplitis demolitor]|uniref:DNA primase large subunit n=1 Tax=Microplitis demolitor TaxID=69319 RepID=UPI0004CD8539|nr:DNA primase large subunit [Microplitis demolitor]
MESKYGIKKRKYCRIEEEGDLRDQYTHDIQMYTQYPKQIVQLDRFYELGYERRQILKLIELILNRSDLKTIEDRKIALKNALKKDGYTHAAKLLTGLGCASHTDAEIEARKRDVLSHFILRLAYSQNPELRKWFVAMEVEYMKMRITSLNNEGMAKLLAINNFTYKPISQEEKETLREELSCSISKSLVIDNIDFYKVPFSKVLDLVKTRRVYLKKGIAYTPQFELSSLFISQYRRHLTKAVEIAAPCFYELQDDERVFDYLKNLPNYFPDFDRTIWSSTETPIEALDDIAKISYPLCMRTLHEALRMNHHLKNSGRVQYGLFLKGIGVKVDDAMRMWRAEFTKKIEADKFEKEYAYTIKFIYGTVGSQKKYTPMGCSKIISNIAGAGEYHGCPYRLMDSDTLKKKLIAYGLSASDAAEIAALAKDHHYQLACAKYYEITHKVPPEHPVMHPNAYYSDSRNIIEKLSSNTVDSHENPTGGDTPKQKLKIKSEKFTPIRTPDKPLAKRNIEVKLMDIEKLLNEDEMD